MKLLYAQLLVLQLTINNTLIYDNLLSTTNIGFATYDHADTVVVTSNVTEHTENTGFAILPLMCISIKPFDYA